MNTQQEKYPSGFLKTKVRPSPQSICPNQTISTHRVRPTNAKSSPAPAPKCPTLIRQSATVYRLLPLKPACHRQPLAASQPFVSQVGGPSQAASGCLSELVSSLVPLSHKVLLLPDGTPCRSFSRNNRRGNQ